MVTQQIWHQGGWCPLPWGGGGALAWPHCSARDVVGNVTECHQRLHLLPPMLVADVAVAEDVQECGASIPWGRESWACELGPEFYNYSVSSSDTKKATL